MAEIFLSYQKKDRDLAQRMNDVLSRAGFSVWWDDDINPRENWDREIEREITKARFVLALWTTHSVESEWVRLEAMEAKNFAPSKLLQARFDDCRLPLAFKLNQYVDLDRDRPDRGRNWAKLLRWIGPANGGDVRETTPVGPRAPPLPDPEPIYDPAPSASATGRLYLALLMILFSVVVGYGWFRFLAAVFDPLPALGVAALITVIALLLAHLVGKALDSGKSEPEYFRRLFFLYPLLFSMSALGTVNGAFYFLEGGAVLRQSLDDAEGKLLTLDGAARAALRNERADARAAAVERLLLQLDMETTNTATCGAGPGVRAVVREIRAILPEFREFSRGRGSRSCDAEALARLSWQYRDTALLMLNLDPAERRRAALRTEIAGSIDQVHMRLHAARAGLAGRSSLSTGYGAALLVLEDAAMVYSEERERLAGAEPAAANALVPAIDIDRARHLGSIGTLPEILAARIGYPTTWLYFLAATLLDLLLIFFFREKLGRTSRIEISGDDERQDLQFLWVNQGA